MALEINEIGVEMKVGQPPAEQQGAPPVDGPPAIAPAQREDIVQACIRRVLAALRTLQPR